MNLKLKKKLNTILILGHTSIKIKKEKLKMLNRTKLLHLADHSETL